MSSSVGSVDEMSEFSDLASSSGVSPILEDAYALRSASALVGLSETFELASGRVHEGSGNTRANPSVLLDPASDSEWYPMTMSVGDGAGQRDTGVLSALGVLGQVFRLFPQKTLNANSGLGWALVRGDPLGFGVPCSDQ